ncbi:MAG: ATP-dependent DNA helicase RuvA [Gemmataceae bacterium]|nr:ATP-dependent DNA helicase RuvA [Gemmataceae bacterium]
MLTKMTGVLARVLDDEARVTVGPFEYQVLIPEMVRRQIQLHTGREVTFHVVEYLEGNAGGNRFVPRRLGFMTESEVEFFELFCTVEKIGAKKALKAMARPVKEIAEAISRQDARWLSTLPGIGAQTAEQIVTTLKRKVTRFAMMSAQPTLPVPPTSQASGGREPPVEPVVVDAKPSKVPRGKKAAEPVAATAPPPVEPSANGWATDGKVIEDVYEALMGLGLNPLDARNKLDQLLTGGKPFKTVQEAIGLAFSTKG